MALLISAYYIFIETRKIKIIIHKTFAVGPILCTANNLNFMSYKM